MQPEDVRTKLLRHDWERPPDVSGRWVHRANFNFLHQTLGHFPRWIRVQRVGNIGERGMQFRAPEADAAIPASQLAVLMPPGWIFIAVHDAYKQGNAVHAQLYGYQATDFSARDLDGEIASRYQYGEPTFISELPAWISLC